tara:strand:+ start:439 stop:966 length:528 start_codon:yes stop_codon:yes gene_type:complete
LFTGAVGYFYSCSSGSLSNYNDDDLVFKSDSILKIHSNDEQMRKLILAAKIKELKKNPNSNQYIEVLKLDPKNPIALYAFHMQTGKLHHQKSYKNGQWDAIQSFYKAAAQIDSLGEPYYWIGKSYEKKDEMDFDSAIESYDKALELSLADSTRKMVETALVELTKKKTIYKDFWK